MNSEIEDGAAFRSKTKNEQLKLLHETGIYIGKRKTGQVVSLLYQYQAMYVEIVYEVYRSEVAEIHYFTNTWILDYYLPSEKVPLQELLLKK